MQTGTACAPTRCAATAHVVPDRSACMATSCASASSDGSGRASVNGAARTSSLVDRHGAIGAWSLATAAPPGSRLLPQWPSDRIMTSKTLAVVLRFGRPRFDGGGGAARARRLSRCSRCRSTITSATGSSWPRRAGSRPTLGAERHIVLPLDLRAFGGSALTADIDVPKGGVGAGIPVTYVPARNTIFLSLALGWAEAAGARDMYHRRQRARLFGLSRLPARIHRGVREAGRRSPPRPASRASRSASTRRCST